MPGFLSNLALKSPQAYSWSLRTFPGLIDAARSTFGSGASNGGVAAIGTQMLGARALTIGQAGLTGARILASAFRGLVIGTAI